MQTVTPSFSFEGMSAEERIALIGELWDSLEPEVAAPITDELAAELDRREAEADASPGEGVPWENVVQELRDRLR